ncbi:EscE/YscE/SsaE family type III secretion system needle protein co-chaperone [Aeromonas veronii]|uniref:EscE/YscE/SsaE family type III secretion system needle protein co-chaperone n=2 Tax=Aeromonas TaxID=642 RepID=A0ABS7VA27_9GAMM|nr:MULTISPECIES: EscE/YscE/SsaE family type III secretion system needle protein co-chaperone [Aeromonas]KUE80359.1 type III secretion system protein, YseE family [Aeromonas schubertii]MBZ6066203.1 EscE/YscE/SsaE family type III secretion system needle protein co-chaperone [Aeromonas schubertii]MBZ6071275.1 EscE/YscE/SsaE family type III secretion system needle protein co-chaperone [Aeromonas schubertii]MCF5913422.1 EscE/YscE/SsaE family type III secretion system needle protein co-chaperone [Aer
MDTLTHLEERLAHDPQGLLRHRLIDQLEAGAHQLAQALRQPQPPEEYARLERQRQSCLAARAVIETLWLRAQHSASRGR